MRSAADQLKKLYGGKGKMRLKLFISVKGIKLFDYHTMVGREQSQYIMQYCTVKELQAVEEVSHVWIHNVNVCC